MRHRVRDEGKLGVWSGQGGTALAVVGGGTKGGKPLSANTVRLARSPLTGALKLAVEQGVIRVNPMTTVARPPTKRKIPKHWSPEQARQFLDSQNGDRMYPLWAFLLGSGLRIGELVWLRWDNVDLVRQHARIVEFASTLGWTWSSRRARAPRPPGPSTSTPVSSGC